ncbi:hypothetical protein [Actinoplanes awajinensis]|uniref:PH domain-containing protein n=1 Tax=Actinoplanes awajinensis subsp. mycoplanecinus TaxID=135947 RepID=A0A117MPX7_9ACTN|nr:hypothetical protein [Actinoplanes awajinensis]KUL29259.1 hypothetical protein ADL15_29325 [Actinoplanes awajinensis subsp. mycoplanecinus]
MYIDFRQGNFRVWAGGVLGSGFFGFAALMAAVNPEEHLVGGDDPTTRFLAWVCTFLFLIPFGALVIFAPKLLGRTGVTVDQAGIHGIPWSDLAGVGIAYKVNPAPQKVPLPEGVRRQGHVLEFFPAPGVDLTDRVAGLRPATEPPPHPGLPSERFRLPMPDASAVPARIEQAVRSYAPHRWLGTYQRTWTPLA